jgi:hypothetical protein
MVAPAQNRPGAAPKPTTAKPGAPKAPGAKPAAKKAEPTMAKDQASFSKPSAPDLPAIKQGDVTARANTLSGKATFDYQADSLTGHAELNDRDQSLSLDLAAQPSDNTKVSLAVSQQKGRAKLKAQVDFKQDGTTARLTADSDRAAEASLAQQLSKGVTASGKVRHQDGRNDAEAKLSLKDKDLSAELGYDTAEGVKAKAAVKAGKELEVSVEAGHQPRKGTEGKARLKLQQTTLEVGMDAKKQLSGGITQQIDSHLSVGVTSRQGKLAAQAKYQADALSLTATVGEKPSIEVGYKKDGFEASAFAKGDQSYGVKFGYSTRF